jgi:hypothetical protein
LLIDLLDSCTSRYALAMRNAGHVGRLSESWREELELRDGWIRNRKPQQASGTHAMKAFKHFGLLPAAPHQIGALR